MCTVTTDEKTAALGCTKACSKEDAIVINGHHLGLGRPALALRETRGLRGAAQARKDKRNHVSDERTAWIRQ